MGASIYRLSETPLPRIREAAVCTSSHTRTLAARYSACSRERPPPISHGRGSQCTFNARHVSGAGAVAASGFLQKPPTPRLARAGARIQSSARPLTALTPYSTNGAPPLQLSPASDLNSAPPKPNATLHAEPDSYWFRILPIMTFTQLCQILPYRHSAFPVRVLIPDTLSSSSAGPSSAPPTVPPHSSTQSCLQPLETLPQRPPPLRDSAPGSQSSVLGQTDPTRVCRTPPPWTDPASTTHLVLY